MGKKVLVRFCNSDCDIDFFMGGRSYFCFHQIDIRQNRNRKLKQQKWVGDCLEGRARSNIFCFPLFFLSLVFSFPTSFPGFLHFPSLSKKTSATSRWIDRRFSFLPHLTCLPFPHLSTHFNYFPPPYLWWRTQKSGRNPCRIWSSEIILLCSLLSK